MALNELANASLNVIGSAFCSPNSSRTLSDRGKRSSSLVGRVFNIVMSISTWSVYLNPKEINSIPR